MRVPMNLFVKKSGKLFGWVIPFGAGVGATGCDRVLACFAAGLASGAAAGFETRLVRPAAGIGFVFLAVAMGLLFRKRGKWFVPFFPALLAIGASSPGCLSGTGPRGPHQVDCS